MPIELWHIYSDGLYSWRQDVFEKHGLPERPPETLEEMVEWSEFLNGKDHNDDGEPDWGSRPDPFFFTNVSAHADGLESKSEGGVGKGSRRGRVSRAPSAIDRRASVLGGSPFGMPPEMRSKTKKKGSA